VAETDHFTRPRKYDDDGQGSLKAYFWEKTMSDPITPERQPQDGLGHAARLQPPENLDSSLNSNQPGHDQNGRPSVHQAIANHQLTEIDWRWNPAIREFHRWKGIFTQELPLPVPEVAFCIGYTRLRCYGYFRPGPNWFGFPREILLRESFVVECLQKRIFWRVLGTQLHELVHAWRSKYGQPGKGNYHNAEFREKAREFGLIVDARGCTDFDPSGPFHQLIAKHGVADLKVPDGLWLQPAGSKLHKWVCGCQPQYGVRVAIEHFDASCNRCGERFIRESCKTVGGQGS